MATSKTGHTAYVGIDSPAARDAYLDAEEDIQAFIDDPDFEEAVDALDVEALFDAFRAFSDRCQTYNDIHRQERRLWALKIGRGEVPTEYANDFRDRIPEAVEAYEGAFSAMDDAVQILQDSGFDTLINRHIDNFTPRLLDESDAFGEYVREYLRRIGNSDDMIDKFLGEFESIDAAFIHGIGPLEEVQALSEEGRQGQIELLNYTEENGFDYLRAKCGPPSWAVTVSNLLAAVGISVSAWAVVAIVSSLIGIIITICVAAPQGSKVYNLCKKVSGAGPIPILRF